MARLSTTPAKSPRRSAGGTPRAQPRRSSIGSQKEGRFSTSSSKSPKNKSPRHSAASSTGKSPRGRSPRASTASQSSKSPKSSKSPRASAAATGSKPRESLNGRKTPRASLTAKGKIDLSQEELGGTARRRSSIAKKDEGANSDKRTSVTGKKTPRQSRAGREETPVRKSRRSSAGTSIKEESPKRSPKAMRKSNSPKRESGTSPMRMVKSSGTGLDIDDRTHNYWVAMILHTAVVLIAISFIYSFSAFKMDLRNHFSWDEATLAYVFFFANIGQNVVVHMGIVYDSFGATVTGLMSAVLKFCGNGGMFYLIRNGINNPLLFGLFFFLDTQATGAAIIMGQMEAQKLTPNAQLTGLVGSICTAAFGLGASFWTGVYDMMLKGDLASHFLASAIVSSIMLVSFVCWLPLFNSKLRDQTTSKAVAKKEKKPFNWQLFGEVAKSMDFVCLFLSTLVTWGVAMVYVSHISTMTEAAGLENASQIRFAFYLCGFIGRSIAGPLTDATRHLGLTLELYAWVTSSLTLIGVLANLVSDSQWMLLSAILCGLGFGGISTLVPLLCRKNWVSMAGTLYAVSKVGSAVMSSVWIGFAAKETDAIKATQGSNVCRGRDCYFNTWVFIVSVCTPIVIGTWFWASRSIDRWISKQEEQAQKKNK